MILVGRLGPTPSYRAERTRRRLVSRRALSSRLISCRIASSPEAVSDDLFPARPWCHRSSSLRPHSSSTPSPHHSTLLRLALATKFLTLYFIYCTYLSLYISLSIYIYIYIHITLIYQLPALDPCRRGRRLASRRVRETRSPSVRWLALVCLFEGAASLLASLACIRMSRGMQCHLHCREG